MVFSWSFGVFDGTAVRLGGFRVHFASFSKGYDGIGQVTLVGALSLLLASGCIVEGSVVSDFPVSIDDHQLRRGFGTEGLSHFTGFIEQNWVLDLPVFFGF